MYVLSERVKAQIEKITGVSTLKISELSFPDKREIVLQKKGNAPFFSRRKRASIAGRGNPLLARKKIRTMEEVDAFLENL